MMESSRGESLEIDQDLVFQRRFWRIQRVGWVIIALLALATLLGVFGAGPLSNVTLGDPNASLRLIYHRFARYKAPTKLQIFMRLQTGGLVRLWITRSYLNNAEVKNIIPPPERVEASVDRLIYVFRIASPGEAAVALGDVAVAFYMEPEQFGRLQGEVGLESEPPLNLQQFIYP